MAKQLDNSENVNFNQSLRKPNSQEVSTAKHFAEHIKNKPKSSVKRTKVYNLSLCNCIMCYLGNI